MAYACAVIACAPEYRERYTMNPFDDFSLNDVQLAVLIKQHKGMIHTQKFPTRCGMCRLFNRMQIAEQACSTMLYVKEAWENLHFGNTLENELNRWKDLAGK